MVEDFLSRYIKSGSKAQSMLDSFGIDDITEDYTDFAYNHISETQELINSLQSSADSYVSKGKEAFNKKNKGLRSLIDDINAKELLSEAMKAGLDIAKGEAEAFVKSKFSAEYKQFQSVMSKSLNYLDLASVYADMVIRFSDYVFQAIIRRIIDKIIVNLNKCASYASQIDLLTKKAYNTFLQLEGLYNDISKLKDRIDEGAFYSVIGHLDSASFKVGEFIRTFNPEYPGNLISLLKESEASIKEAKKSLPTYLSSSTVIPRIERVSKSLLEMGKLIAPISKNIAIFAKTYAEVIYYTIVIKGMPDAFSKSVSIMSKGALKNAETLRTSIIEEAARVKSWLKNDPIVIDAIGFVGEEKIRLDMLIFQSSVIQRIYSTMKSNSKVGHSIYSLCEDDLLSAGMQKKISSMIGLFKGIASGLSIGKIRASRVIGSCRKVLLTTQNLSSRFRELAGKFKAAKPKSKQAIQMESLLNIVFSRSGIKDPFISAAQGVFAASMILKAYKLRKVKKKRDAPYDDREPSVYDPLDIRLTSRAVACFEDDEFEIDSSVNDIWARLDSHSQFIRSVAANRAFLVECKSD